MNLIQLNVRNYRRRFQYIPLGLRRQISLKINAIQIQTNSPRAEGAVYWEIRPSLLRPVFEIRRKMSTNYINSIYLYIHLVIQRCDLYTLYLHIQLVTNSNL